MSRGGEAHPVAVTLAQDQLTQSKTKTAMALVTLYKALAGGWEK